VSNHLRQAASCENQVRATENISGIYKIRSARWYYCEALSRCEGNDVNRLSRELSALRLAQQLAANQQQQQQNNSSNTSNNSNNTANNTSSPSTPTPTTTTS